MTSSSGAWVCPDVCTVNQRRGAEAWELGINIWLPDPGEESPGWFADIEATVLFWPIYTKEHFADIRDRHLRSRAWNLAGFVLRPYCTTRFGVSDQMHSDKIKTAIDRFEGVAWSNCGDPEECEGQLGPGWVKFRVVKGELGWRTIEFLAWVVDDMSRAGERIRFFPTAPPPYLNDPGGCLSFVVGCYALKTDDAEERFAKIAAFVDRCRREHWSECKP